MYAQTIPAVLRDLQVPAIKTHAFASVWLNRSIRKKQYHIIVYAVWSWPCREQLQNQAINPNTKIKEIDIIKEEHEKVLQQFQDLLDIKEKELDEYRKKPVRLFILIIYMCLFKLILPINDFNMTHLLLKGRKLKRT